MNRISGLFLAALLISAAPASAGADDTAPYLYILGVAQDAGYPQAGCYRPHCMPGWQNRDRRRAVVSLGLVDPASGNKYLFEATPDLPEQLYELEQVAPSEHFSLAGVFLTHAHIGHYTGLMYFGHEAMGAQDVPVFAMPRMRGYLADNGPWSQLVDYGNIELEAIEADVPVRLGAVTVTAFRVPHREEFSEAVGFRIDGPNKSALFIPDIDKWALWEKDLEEQLRGVDYALVDATFYAGGELPGRDMSQVPHPFVVESMALLADLPAGERSKVWFIHFNHSNPLLDADSEASRAVREAGFNIAVEGLRLVL
ncbi:MAG TPA: MBL fold metallo-hydrolase [Xanthomonadales bacterium]|nr:MBL fold metallo-hydrolase [Xanthomonadales bacterium]